VVGRVLDAPEDRRRRGVARVEIEDWLAGVQEDRELANATINKLRGTFTIAAAPPRETAFDWELVSAQLLNNCNRA